jgi:hypothetical protein
MAAAVGGEHRRDPDHSRLLDRVAALPRGFAQPVLGKDPRLAQVKSVELEGDGVAAIVRLRCRAGESEPLISFPTTLIRAVVSGPLMASSTASRTDHRFIPIG